MRLCNDLLHISRKWLHRCGIRPFQKMQQILDISLRSLDWRKFQLPALQPDRRSEIDHLLDDLLMHLRIAHDALLADLLPARLELWLDPAFLRAVQPEVREGSVLSISVKNPEGKVIESNLKWLPPMTIMQSAF